MTDSTLPTSGSTADLLASLGIALRGAALSFPLVGAVVFGSLARGRAGAGSDIDLLAVGTGLPVQRHRRGPQMCEVKRALSGLPVDVLLMMPPEADGNFTNHNPVFLDIAEDGVVLLDRDGMLARAMDATRRYIRERQLIRIPGGWRFPVVSGVPTRLSHVSNQDFARAMLAEAERDLRSGERLQSAELWDRAVYHYQQTAEKAVKAVLATLGVFQRTHLVGAILRRVAEEGSVPPVWRERLGELAGISEELEPEVTLSRYPGIVDGALWLPSQEYAQEDAEAAAEKATRARSLAAEFVSAWFSGPAA